jgi:hypothetical protein
MKNSSFALLIALAAFMVSGCGSGGLTWRNNPYRGKSVVRESVRWTDPSGSFALLSRQLVTKGYRPQSFSGELLIAEFRYEFTGTETWGGAKQVMAKYTEPLANGVLPNPYGKNSWVEVSLSVQAGDSGGAALEAVFVFKTWGEADGVGGAGPYPLNSRGVFEAEFQQEIKNFLTSAKNLPNSDQPRKRVDAL